MSLAPQLAKADLCSDVLKPFLKKNRIRINSIHAKGASIQMNSGIGMGKPMFKVRNVKVEGAVLCKQDGYRVRAVNPKPSSGEVYYPKLTSSEWEGEVSPQFADDNVMWKAHQACAAGKNSIALDVTFSGKCEKAKVAVGQTHVPLRAKPRRVDFRLTCANYDIAKAYKTWEKCKGGGCG